VGTETLRVPQPCWLVLNGGKFKTMHELSIVHSIVETAMESARQANAHRVVKVHLRLGALSGIVRDSLLFCYTYSTRDTILEGSQLEIENVPVIIHCPTCNADRQLRSIQRFRCPVCDTPSADVRQGKEMEVGSIEVEVT
jgi:hydrogenase nickel incorporation protein HypA/HybF